MAAKQAPLAQAKFDPRIYTLAKPLSGGSGVIQRGYMIWDKPLPGYTGKAAIHYLYNPSTVSSDYSIADATAQAALNFPNPGDTAMLAIPLSQTVSWTLMFDRTFELWGSYDSDGTPNNKSAAVNDPSVIGVQSDVMQFMQFTGMLTNYSYGTATTSGLSKNSNYSLNQGIMQLVPCYAYFGNSQQANNASYYGYISEWSVQYTHWTQYNIPMRAVVSVYFTMLPPPAKQTTAPAGNDTWYVYPTPTGAPPAGGIVGKLLNNTASATNGVAGR